MPSNAVVPNLAFVKDRPPYERQPGEKRFAWRAFCLYRDLGPERTLWGVCKPLRDFFQLAQQADPTKKFPKAGRIVQLIEGWWTAHRWWDRVGAWDRAQTAAKDRQHRLDMEEMESRHVLESKSLQTKALLRLQAMNPNDLNPRDVLSYLKEAMRLETMARGKPSTIRQTEITGKGGGPVTAMHAHAHSHTVAEAPKKIVEILVTTRAEVKDLLARGLMEGENVIGS